MIKLIAILLIVVMGLCVVGIAEGFERQEDISIESEDVKSNMDEIALQLEDFDISIDEDCLYETDIEEMYPKSEADAKINTSTDFDIRDGVLIKYNGAGGDVVIPNGVHSIGRRAFSGCQDITGVVVPDSVTEFGEDAFVWCKSLKTINIPGGVTNIGECAFLNCISLKEIVIPDSVLEIGNQAFEGCISLESASIGNGLRKLTYSIFSNCTSLERVSIGRNVASINENAFEYCESLERITLPFGVSRIEVHAFAGCKNLFSIVIPDSVTSIEEYAFDECPNLTIYGESKSYAEKYAKENGIPFKIRSSSEQGLTIDQGEKATLYMGNKLTLTTNYDGNLKWKSSKKDVATVSTKGVVTPKKAGTTIITVKAGNNNKSQITIKVVDAKSIEITQGEMHTMTIGDSLDLVAKIIPTGVKTKLTWESSNKKIATVDKKGTVKAIKEGSANISVKTTNNKKAIITITVKTGIEPEKITLNKKKVTLRRNNSLQLKATMQPSNAKDKKVIWSSSRPSVATVNSEGVVIALRPGKTEITATSNSDKSVKDSCVITVPGKYRALLIGQNNYEYASKLKGCINDANSMKKMIAGLEDNYVVNSVKKDRTADEICQDILECFGDATDDDVSVFFYSGHGHDDNGGAYQGALCGVDGSYLTTDALAVVLGSIHGRIIVIVDACYSGALISTNQDQRKNNVKQDSSLFVQSFINAFEKCGPKNNHAEFRDSKYIVLVAASFKETSAESIWRKGKFTGALIKGMGCNYSKGTYKGSMPADKNKDNAVTVEELYNYIRKKVWSLVGKQTTGYYADNKKEIMFGH